MLDKYERRARLLPLMLVVAPLAASTLPLLGEVSVLQKLASAAIVQSGAAFVLTQLLRFAGNRIEPKLFAAWGGAPTVQLLRHRGPATKETVKVRHEKLARAFPTVSLPTEADELRDPAAADRAYDAAVRPLLGSVRDNRLVFEENRAYGFWRNALGVRVLGIAASALGLCVVVASYVTHSNPNIVESLLVASFDAALLLFWAVAVRNSMVRAVAFKFAERLLDSPL